VITEAGLIAVVCDARQPEMTTRQLAVLALLARDTEILTCDLAERVAASKSVITRYCDKMLDLGFVKRRRGVEDRRRCYVAITSTGRRYLAALAR
jgi:DNA-binding MarR family transcriptional regulator